MLDLIKKIRIDEYDYELPDERIARYPVEPRDASKLLVYQNGSIEESRYKNLPEQLPEDALLLFNQTKVVQARLHFQKNDRPIEVFCLEPAEAIDIQQAMATKGSIRYKCLIGGARRWKSGSLEMTTKNGTMLSVEKGDRHEGSFEVQFSWDRDLRFAQVLEEAGKTPLPPYLNREAEEEDRERYQTVWAANEGSVAAPTAGLHFTPALLSELKNRGTDQLYITLHVGAGTFKPVSSDTIAEHSMHSEEFFISRDLILNLLEKLNKKIIPVGTTSMRALESLYWLGIKLMADENSPLEVNQWDPYELSGRVEPEQALRKLAEILEKRQQPLVVAYTSLIIAPGYQHRICSGLLTNFHQPKSTLLLLVASFIGEDWKSLYRYALDHEFRFLSYGDGCLLLRS